MAGIWGIIPKWPNFSCELWSFTQMIKSTNIQYRISSNWYIQYLISTSTSKSIEYYYIYYMHIFPHTHIYIYTYIYIYIYTYIILYVSVYACIHHMENSARSQLNWSPGGPLSCFALASRPSGWIVSREMELHAENKHRSICIVDGGINNQNQ